MKMKKSKEVKMVDRYADSVRLVNRWTICQRYAQILYKSEFSDEYLRDYTNYMARATRDYALWLSKKKKSK